MNNDDPHWTRLELNPDTHHHSMNVLLLSNKDQPVSLLVHLSA